MSTNDILIKNESLQTINLDEMIHNNKDVSLKPINCQSNISIEFMPNSRPQTAQVSKYDHKRNIHSSSSDRDIWKQRIDNVNNTEMNIPQNDVGSIENIAEAMGMSRLSFDQEAQVSE